MEAVVVGCMFKSLITRCASTTHELHSPENLVSPYLRRPSSSPWWRGVVAAAKLLNFSFLVFYSYITFCDAQNGVNANKDGMNLAS